MARLVDLIPHRPPWLRLDHATALDPRTVVAVKRLSAGDPLVGGDGLAETLIVELAAQAAACLMGERSQGRAGHLGYLVSVRAWKFHRRPTAGETLTLEVSLRSELGALAGFAARARVDERPIADGELTCAVRFDDAAPGY